MNWKLMWPLHVVGECGFMFYCLQQIFKMDPRRIVIAKITCYLFAVFVVSCLLLLCHFVL
jgi:hypothetical protein